MHRRAEWALSVDIENFFQTTPAYLVTKSLVELGYSATAATLMTSLTCYNRALAQGAPSSSTLSNICFGEIDSKLAQLAKHYECRLTRYADDIVFSGRGSMPPSLRGELRSVFEGAPWKLAPEKERVQPIKGRIKVYGLLVNGATVRMTKGYRNKVAAYKHILETRGDNVDNPRALKGHVQYAQHVERKLRELEFRELHLVSDATEFR